MTYTSIFLILGFQLRKFFGAQVAPAFSSFVFTPQLQNYSTEMSKAFITKPAPAFTKKALLPSGEFKDITLSDYLGKWVVLFFYPLDFTFVCPSYVYLT